MVAPSKALFLPKIALDDWWTEILGIHLREGAAKENEVQIK
jgi:hypothetical protein